jgi:hypothetical protein
VTVIPERLRRAPTVSRQLAETARGPAARADPAARGLRPGAVPLDSRAVRLALDAARTPTTSPGPEVNHRARQEETPQTESAPADRRQPRCGTERYDERLTWSANLRHS